MATRRVVIPIGFVLAASVFAGAPRPADAATSAETRFCRKQVSAQARVYQKKRQSLLLGCIDKLLKCEMLLELDGDNPNGCRGTATDSCARRVGPASDSILSRARQRFRDKAAAACLPVGLADLLNAGAGGLWYANDADCGGAPDIPTLMECLRDEMESQIDALVGRTKPRAGILLDNVGLGDEFDDLPRPPTVDVVVMATAPGSGVLVDPGPINVPQGSALRFTGDAGLVCGNPGNNGRVTITVGAGPTAQQLQLREPYGAGEVAIFGPYTAAASLPYEIDLKEGSCDDVVTDTVTVP